MQKTLLVVWLGLLLFPACEEGFQLNAPFKDIWVVYGLLRLDDSVQYVRISKVFQTESNAFDQAAEQDYTAKGLTVTLSGNGQTLVASQTEDLQREPGGDFPLQLTLYRFDTQGSQRLEEGVVYTLTVTADSLPGFRLEARTRIPPRPRLMRPVPRKIEEQFCLQTVVFEDSFDVIFRTREDVNVTHEAYGHEIRAGIDYVTQAGPKSYRYGPTKLFTASRGCVAGLRNARCYRFRNGVVMNSMRGHFTDPLARYQYTSLPFCAERSSQLADAVRIEVTAVDTILGRYMQANDPRFLNINTIRPEFSNVSGTQEALGIFGSIAIDDAPVGLSECAKYLLYLNGVTEDPCN